MIATCWLLYCFSVLFKYQLEFGPPVLTSMHYLHHKLKHGNDVGLRIEPH